MNRLRAVLKGSILLFAAAIAAGLWAGAAQAQIDPNSATVRATSRALIQESFTMMGFAGQSPNIGRGRAGLGYPNNGSGPGAYGIVLAQEQSGPKATYGYGYSTSGGECTWIMTSDGGVTVTGPRPSAWIKDFIRPVPYDPKGKEEEAWGVPDPLLGLWQRGVTATPGTSLATYWPGITKANDGSIYAADKPEQIPPVQIANYKLSGYIQNPNAPEEVIITQWSNTKQGFLTTRKSYDWSNPDFDDFILVDYVFTNLGDFNGDGKEDDPAKTKTQENVYFAFVNAEGPTGMGANWFRSPDGWGVYIWQDHNVDDAYFYSDASNYRGAFPKGLKASIWRDSDWQGSSWDDTGDPFYLKEAGSGTSTGKIGQTEGQMQAAATWAMVPMAYRNAGASHVFNPKDRAGKFVDPQGEQPSGAKWWKIRGTSDYDDPYSEKDTEKKIHGEITAPGIKDNPNEAIPEDRVGYVHGQVYGPYTLKPGESAKVVMAYVAGHPAQMRNQDLLAWDRSTEPVEKKQSEIKTLGEQALLENARLAQFTYDSEYRIPAAPTNAFIAKDDLTGSPNAHQQITWVDHSDRAVNPYSKEADVLGYRIYRSNWFAVGPWELWDTIEKGKSGQSVKGSWTYGNGVYVYEDLQSAAGFEYHYSVRPYAKGYANWSATLSDGSTKTLADIPVARVRTNVTRGYEAGWGPYTARTYDGESRPFQPVTKATDNLEKKVQVVPNPYFVDGLHAYPNSRNIRFVGIPRKAKIYIYSASGDMVQTLVHDETVVRQGARDVPKTTGQKGETVFRQITWNLAGQISTGLYYFVVVSEVPESMGKTQRGTFVVIK